MHGAGGTLHSFLSILAGFLTIVLMMGFATVVLRRFAPEFSRDNEPADLFTMSANLGIGLLCGFAGGYVTARIAGLANPTVHSLAQQQNDNGQDQ